MTTLPMPRSVFAPLTFTTVAVAALALAWHDWQRSTLTPPVPVEISAVPAAAPPTAAPPSRERLAELALFGAPAPDAAPAVAPAPPLDEAALPESAAAYRLYGVIEADRPHAARAIIGPIDGEQREFRVGDRLPDGAQLRAVRERAAILERGAQLERLALPAADADGSAPGPESPLPDTAPFGFVPAPTYAPPATPPTEALQPMAPTEVPPAPDGTGFAQ